MTDGVRIVDLVREAHRNSAEHGFWSNDENKNIPTKLALIHSEVSEALEAYRKGNDENFAEELADVFIRLGDLCGWLDIDIEDAIAKKMIVNKARPIMHGGKRI